MSGALGVETFRKEIETTLLEHAYEMLDVVGSGNYASVYRVRSSKYNEIFCCKVMHVPEGDKHKAESRIRSYGHEINSLMQLSHPNIINFYDHFTSEHCYYIILEYCPNGCLKDWIGRRVPTGEVLRDLMRQLAGALACCHAHHICHRDIKPHNVLIDKYGHLKLADFGLAAILAETSTEKVGSLPYMAPEAFDARARVDPYAGDIWSLGVTFFQMATGFLPWIGTEKTVLVTEIRSGDVPYPIDMDPSLQVLLRKMMDSDPMRRIKAEALEQSDYLQPGKLFKAPTDPAVCSNDSMCVPYGRWARVNGSLSAQLPQGKLVPPGSGGKWCTCYLRKASFLRRKSVETQDSKCGQQRPANWKLHFPIASSGLIGRKL